MSITRKHLIEQILRQVYGGYPSDDSNITENLVNQYINQGIGIAAKANYKDNIAIDGIGYVNNSFYTTFKGLAVTKDEEFLYKVTLPDLPFGIGTSEGISSFKFKDADGNVSQNCILISQNQNTYADSMRPIPNKTIAYSEGTFAYAKSTIDLTQYTATITMVSGGDSTNLNSVLNVPQDYIPTIVEYVKQQLLVEKQMPKDLSNDGIDN